MTISGLILLSIFAAATGLFTAMALLNRFHPVTRTIDLWLMAGMQLGCWLVWLIHLGKV